MILYNNNLSCQPKRVMLKCEAFGRASKHHNLGIRWIGDKTPDILFVMDVKDTVIFKENMDRDTTYLLCRIIDQDYSMSLWGCN